MNIAHLLFGIFGNATALFLFLAPIITFKRIIQNKSTEKFSGIPYVMTLLNCLLSAWYGLPFVSPNNILVSTINGTGAGIEIIYVFMFIIFAPRREKAMIPFQTKHKATVENKVSTNVRSPKILAFSLLGANMMNMNTYIISIPAPVPLIVDIMYVMVPNTEEP